MGNHFSNVSFGYTKEEALHSLLATLTYLGYHAYEVKSSARRGNVFIHNHGFYKVVYTQSAVARPPYGMQEILEEPPECMFKASLEFCGH